MDQTYQVLSTLLSPQIWWLWESVVIGMYFAIKLFSTWGKTKVFVMQKIGDVWFSRPPKFISTAKMKNFDTGKKEHRVQEIDKTAFMEAGAMGTTNPVLFYDKKRARPMYATFEQIPHNPSKGVYNPTTDNWRMFAKEEAFRQGKEANKTNQKPPTLLIIMTLLAGLGIGAVIAFALLGHSTIPGIGSNGAVTQTLQSLASNSTSITTHTITYVSTDANGVVHTVTEAVVT